MRQPSAASQPPLSPCAGKLDDDDDNNDDDDAMTVLTPFMI